MPRIERLYFTVVGRGAFPLDMLRYDACWPARGEDVTAILASAKSGRTPCMQEQRTVRLATDKQPVSEGRWFSFGWTVGYDR